MGCKGICMHYKASRPQSGGRYITGQKRCQTCDIYYLERYLVPLL